MVQRRLTGTRSGSSRIMEGNVPIETVPCQKADARAGAMKVGGGTEGGR